MIETSTRPLLGRGALGQLALGRPALLPTSTLGWLRLPSVPFVLALLAFAVPWLVTSGPVEGDIWWVLKHGQLLVASGQLGTSDPFTFSPHTAADMNVQWLAQLTYYAAYLLLGLPGVMLFNSVTIAATFGVLFDVARRRSRSLLAATLATLVAEVVCAWALTPRAQTLGFLLFAASTWLLACAPRRVPAILGLAVLEAVWANVHGSFFLAPLLTGVLLVVAVWTSMRSGGVRSVLVACEPRFLGVVLACQAVASLATPYGVGLYAYVLRLTSNTAVRDYALEWKPTNIHQWEGLCFFASLGVTAILLGRRRRGIALGDILTVALFGLLGLQAVRNVAWWALASAPVLAVALADSPVPGRILALGGRVGSARHNLLRAGLVAVVVVSLCPVVRPANPLLPATLRDMVPVSYPRGAAEFLLAHDLGPRVFADQPWGNYLDWQLWPRYQVMFDSSIETHPAEVWTDYFDINSGHVSWQQRLDGYGVGVLLLSRAEQQRLIDLAAASPNWDKVYEDDLALIYVPASLGEPSR